MVKKEKPILIKIRDLSSDSGKNEVTLRLDEVIWYKRVRYNNDFACKIYLKNDTYFMGEAYVYTMLEKLFENTHDVVDFTEEDVKVKLAKLMERVRQRG